MAAEDALGILGENGVTPIEPGGPARSPGVGETVRLSASDTSGASGIGFGSVWVTSFDERVVRRYDATTGTLKATIKVGEGPDNVGFGAGSVWISNHHGGSVARIDPVTDRVVATIAVGSLGRGGPAGSVFGAGRVWVALPLDERVVGIDVRSNKVTDTIDVDDRGERDIVFYPCSVAFALDRVWVNGCEETPPWLAVIDPSDGTTVTDIRPDLALPPISADRVAWLRSGSHQFTAIDPETLREGGSIRVEGEIRGVVQAFGYVWVLTPGRLLRYDIRTFDGD